MKPNLSFGIKAKKTPFQRHKELEEERKKKADEEAAKIYEEFVESFAAEDDSSGPKPFVRGGTVVPGSRAPIPDAGGGRKPGGKYIPSFMPPAAPEARTPRDREREPDRDRDHQYHRSPSGSPRSEDDESVFRMPSKKAAGDKPRNIDKMLDELKREQEARDERLRLRREGVLPADLPDDGMGSMDDGDPFTTNLYVGNLAPTIDEEVLKREFGRFGPIASVKIMWPRSEEQRRVGRNCGFVAFMRREDAEQALDKLNGLVLHDNEMKIGWGKSIPLPAVPLYMGTAIAAKGAAVPPPSSAGAAAGPWPHGGGGGGAGSAAAAVAAASFKGAGGGYGPRDPVAMAAAAQQQPDAPGADAWRDIVVQIPEDARMRYIIDTLAVYVLRDGCAFEQLVMEAEQRNPEYSFLFDLSSSGHVYYRWRLYSLAEGDTLRTWRVEPFVMVEGGQGWIPPPQTAGQAGKPTDARERERQLSDLERDRFEDMLRGLSAERRDICDAMVFALDNADAAADVVDILAESLTLPETPLALKVARLFLASDILHNSTAPVRNASRYRARLEVVLPDVFLSLQDTSRAAAGRMLQESLRRHVLRLLRIWREWFIFSDDYLNGLQAMFLHGDVINNAAASSSSGTSGADGSSSNPELRAQLEALSDDDLTRRCRHAGLPQKGGRDAQIARLLALDAYAAGDLRGGPDSSRGGSGALLGVGSLHSDGGGAVATADVTAVEPVAAPTAVPTSRWTAVDEEEEKQQLPGVPISKWLLDEEAARRQKQLQQEAAAAAAAEAAAAAAAAAAEPSAAADSDSDRIFSDADMSPARMGGADSDDDNRLPTVTPRLAATPSGRAGEPSTAGAAGASITDAAAEERRQKLRKVEVAVTVYRDQLEEEGTGKEEIEAEVATYRSQLMNDLEKEALAAAAATAVAAAAKASTSRPSSDKHRSSRSARPATEASGGQRDAERVRSRRDRSRSRSRSRERKRSRERSKERSRERSPNAKSSRAADKSSRSSRDKEAAGRDNDKDKPRRHDSRDKDRTSDKEHGSSRDRGTDKDRVLSKSHSARERDSHATRSKGRDSGGGGHDRDEKERDSEREKRRSGSASTHKRGRSRSRSRSRSRDKPSAKDKDRDKARKRHRS